MDIKHKIFNILDFDHDIQVEYTDFDGVYVKYANNKAIVSNYTKSFMTRSLALLVKGIKEGKDCFEIKEQTPIKSRGVHIELSRNAVMRVDSIKEYIDTMACLGLNSLYLYMEDVYKLDGYPYFGYMRGVYSQSELKEIDDYAWELGIEVIPEIQTLGHMEQYLKWPAAGEVSCTRNILLCGEEKTYELIDAIIGTMRGAFRSKRIHIGCDEAGEMWLGAYYERHGFRKSIDIMLEHVTRVMEICDKYDFYPMMYSDMIFHTCSPEKGFSFYDLNVKFTDEIKARIPDADLVYWDYSHMYEEDYVKRINLHRELDRNIVMCCAIQGFNDLLPRPEYTFRSMIPSIQAAIKCGVTDVYATTWGDDGNECNKFYEMFELPLLSELCFSGAAFEMEQFYDMCEFMFGIAHDFYDYVGQSTRTYTMNKWWGMTEGYHGKSLFYTDILYNLTGTEEYYGDEQAVYAEAAEKLNGSFKNDKWKLYEHHAVKIYEILTQKAGVIYNIRKAYKAKNMEYFKDLADTVLPELIEKYNELLKSWQKMWLDTCKPFGWEVINGRMGFVTARLNYALEVISAYANGEIHSIEELEEEFLEGKDMARFPGFGTMVSTSLGV